VSDKAAAAKLMQILMRQSGELDSLLAEIQGECSEAQFIKYRRIVGRIMGSMLLDGINVLSDELPELRPRELNND
jgi:hypothetical protein